MSFLDEIPQEAAVQGAIQEMVYVERLPEPKKTSVGLFLPGSEFPKMHICRVISVGEGSRGESGALSANRDLQPGDYVYVKNPFGIGPKDDEYGYNKFSYVRYADVCAKFEAGDMADEIETLRTQQGEDGDSGLDFGIDLTMKGGEFKF
eukprot:CAMPEP_0117757768 /NCGR_PEP_ID=MMETSP0947-20121206/14941_1 /TAXON_ID=44440 /ORGANISM="Chattonella subsalsa, Strain CCMP2191" /LENGTH=148 /DNA_ID=CAMNT_0005577751 /DNA_START=241 /DNA_END=687 /DNA_ORIENTATION=+